MVHLNHLYEKSTNKTKPFVHTIYLYKLLINENMIDHLIILFVRFFFHNLFDDFNFLGIFFFL